VREETDVKRIGVLGAGAHAALHCTALKVIQERYPERLELSAICSRDKGRAADYQRRFGFRRAFADVGEMLAEKRLDGLIAVTPADRNAEIVRTLLPYGVSLLIEKPPGRNSREARELQEQIRRQGIRYMCSYNRRFSPAFQKALAWIGERPRRRRPAYVLARMLRHERLEPDFVTGTAIHMFDPVLLLLGEPTRVDTVSAPAASGRCPHYYTRASFPQGGHAELVIAPDAGIVEESYEIHGPGCRILVDFWRCRISIVEADRTVLEWRSAEGSLREYEDGTVEETLAFLSLLEGEQPELPTVASGAAGLRLGEAIEAGGIANLEP
jgi:predicted dehydrogenase